MLAGTDLVIVRLSYSRNLRLTSVAIGNPERHMRKASLCGSKQQ